MKKPHVYVTKIRQVNREQPIQENEHSEKRHLLVRLKSDISVGKIVTYKNQSSHKFQSKSPDLMTHQLYTILIIYIAIKSVDFLSFHEVPVKKRQDDICKEILTVCRLLSKLHLNVD